MTTPKKRKKEDHQKLACIQCKRLSTKHTRIKEAVSLYGNGSQPKVILPIGDIWKHLGKENDWQLVARGWEYYSVSHNGQNSLPQQRTVWPYSEIQSDANYRRKHELPILFISVLLKIANRCPHG